MSCTHMLSIQDCLNVSLLTTALATCLLLGSHAAAGSECCKIDVAKTMKVYQLSQAPLHGASMKSLAESGFRLAGTMYTNWILMSDCWRASHKPGHKALEKQLIRARADHDELIIDGKEVSQSVSQYAENHCLLGWHTAMHTSVIMLYWSSPHGVTTLSGQAVYTTSVVHGKDIGHFLSLA